MKKKIQFFRQVPAYGAIQLAKIFVHNFRLFREANSTRLFLDHSHLLLPHQNDFRAQIRKGSSGPL